MKAVIIDDEASNRENLAKLLGRHCPGLSVCGSAGDIDSGLRLIHQHQPELVFLDIQLGGSASGFDLLKKLSAINFEIIFVTAYDQYGIHAVKFAALDYLLKPVDILELMAAVEKAEKKIAARQQNDRLLHLVDFLKTGPAPVSKIALPLLNETLYVNVKEIIRCEADNSYTFFFLTSGERVLVSRTLKEFAELLEPYGFARAHQSHLVNVQFVKSWLREDGGTLLLTNEQKVPVSKPNRERVRAQLGRQV